MAVKASGTATNSVSKKGLISILFNSNLGKH